MRQVPVDGQARASGRHKGHAKKKSWPPRARARAGRRTHGAAHASLPPSPPAISPRLSQGFNWAGFNYGLGFMEGVGTPGSPAIAADFATAVYRQALLGFNLVRLPFRFDGLDAPPPSALARPCKAASRGAVRRALSFLAHFLAAYTTSWDGRDAVTALRERTTLPSPRAPVARPRWWRRTRPWFQSAREPSPGATSSSCRSASTMC